MTELQVFAFLILPASLLVIGYLAVLSHEKRGISKSDSNKKFDVLEMLLRAPFQLRRDNVTSILVVAFNMSAWGYLFSYLTPGVPNWAIALIAAVLGVPLAFFEPSAIKRNT